MTTAPLVVREITDLEDVARFRNTFLHCFHVISFLSLHLKQCSIHQMQIIASDEISPASCGRRGWKAGKRTFTIVI